MARSLNGVTLPKGLQWADKLESANIQQSTARTLSGAGVVWYQKTTGLRPITLIAELPWCWLYWEWVERLESWQQVPGAQYAFQWDNFSSAVMFAHQSPPAVALTPRYNISDPTLDRYTGSIKLFTI